MPDRTVKFIRKNLPSDVRELFYSGTFWYAASVAKTGWHRPAACGVGETPEEAVEDMRQLLALREEGK